MIDTWAVGHPILSIACIKRSEDFMVAVGCELGALLIRRNWDIITTHYAGNDNITDLKFIKDGESLMVASADNNIYIMKYMETAYELCYFATIESGVPISLDVSKNGESILIATDKRKLLISKFYSVDANNYELNFTY